MQLQILRIVDGGKQKIRQRIFLLSRRIAHRRSEIALWVVIDEKYALVFICQSRGEIQSSRRLADTALLIGDCNNGILIKNDFTRFSWISFDVNEMLTPFSIILSCSCVTTSGYS